VSNEEEKYIGDKREGGLAGKIQRSTLPVRVRGEDARNALSGEETLSDKQRVQY